MKTSNKLLIGAIAIIVIIMIAANMRLKSGIEDLKNKQGVNIEQNDSTLHNDSTSNMNINIYN